MRINPFKPFCRLLERTKSWSIRAQLLTYFLVSLTVLLMLINLVAVLNLWLLKERSVSQVKVKARELVEHDIVTSAGLMGKVLSVYLESGLMLLATVQEALIESLENTIISLTPLESYVYSKLPQSCMQFNPQFYGPSPVCISNSNYLPLSLNVNSTLLQRTAQLDYLLPQLGSVSYAGALLHRLTMYYESYGFVRVFPGTNLPNEYDPQDTFWYQEFQGNDFTAIATNGYNETFGANLTILSLVYPLFDNSGNRIGAMSMDVTVSDIYGLVSNTTQNYDLSGDLNDTSIVLVSRFGQTLPNPYDQEWHKSENLDITEAVNNPNSVHTMEIHGQSRQVAAAALPESTDWWYAVVLLLPSGAINAFDSIESVEIEEAASWVLIVTILSSLLVLTGVSLCICVYSERLTAPLRGVTHFAKRIPNATAIRRTDILQLEELEEGENNVRQLVDSFKRLVRRLMEQPAGPSKATRYSRAQKCFPRNELYKAGRWRSELRRL